MGLALASGRSVLEPAGTHSVRHGGSFLQLLTEATTVAPSLPKPGHANPIHHGRAHRLAVDIVLPGEVGPECGVKSGELPSPEPGRAIQAP